MADARATARCAMPVALASLLLLLIAVAAAVAATGEPADPDMARTRRIVDCTAGCVTEAIACATRCADGRGGEAPVCAAACVQAHIGCVAGCGQQQPAPAPPAA